MSEQCEHRTLRNDRRSVTVWGLPDNWICGDCATPMTVLPTEVVEHAIRVINDVSGYLEEGQWSLSIECSEVIAALRRGVKEREDD